MAYTDADKQAYKKRCQKNYHVYQGRIKKLEKRAQQSNEPHKLLAEIKTIQQDLKAKQDGKKFILDLFGRGPDSTRAKFQKRLNSLYQKATKDNKELLKKSISDLNSQLDQGKCKFDSLKQLNPMLAAVPFKDKDRNQFKKEIDALFGKWKDRQSDPEADQLIADLEKTFKKAQNQMRGLATIPLTVPSFKDSWKKMFSIHKELKCVQRQVTKTQQFLKKRSIDQKKRGQLYGRINKVWQGTQRCWNNKGLTTVSTWIEEITASNFQYFDSQIQQLESDSEGAPARPQIQSLQQKIKNVEAGMKASDANGNPLHPLKRSKWGVDAWDELFARTWSLKQHLMGLWDNTPVVASREFVQLKDEIELATTRLNRATTVDEMYQARNDAKDLHKKRKDLFLQKKKLSAPENGRLVRRINFLDHEAYNLIHIAKPREFSTGWLAEAYNQNRQNVWVVFVDDVPSIR